MAKAKPDEAPEDPPPPPPPPELGANANGAEKGANVDKEAGISTAKGNSTQALGEQVHPATQTSEKDGARTLVNPVVDPGPFVKEGRPKFRHPDKAKGEHRYADCNEPMTVAMRTSTGHDHGFGRADEVIGEGQLPPEVFATGAASDVYNKEQGDNLTDVAQRKSAEGSEPAPLHE